MEGIDIQGIVRQAIQEFVNNEQAKTSRTRRNARGAKTPGATGTPVERTGGGEQTQPQDGGGGRTELDGARGTAAFGRGKIDLAFKAVQDGVVRTEDGRLIAPNEAGEMSLKEYLSAFVRRIRSFCRRGLPVARDDREQSVVLCSSTGSVGFAEAP